jgi:hypothetical protein
LLPPKPPLLLPPKLEPLKPPKPLPLKLPPLPLLKPPLHRRVLWVLSLLARGLETLEQALWLKLRLLLRLLRQWVDKVLARLGFSKQCNQPRKPLVAHRVVSPQYLSLPVTSAVRCLKGFKHSLIKSKVLAKAPALRLLRQTQARVFKVSKAIHPLTVQCLMSMVKHTGLPTPPPQLPHSNCLPAHLLKSAMKLQGKEHLSRACLTSSVRSPKKTRS